MTLIDLRSDTVTRPTPAMRQAMANAEVGDDVYGDDPTVRRLEETVAALLGKEAALFVPSGTMGNQIALQLHTRRGDAVIVGEGAHIHVDESGAGSAWAGVMYDVAGRGGPFTAADLHAVLQGPDIHGAPQRLLSIENPHSRGGGRIFPAADVAAVTEIAKARGLRLHLDGARLWNAEAATGASPSDLCEPFDTVSVCFSKGLGAPVGSAIAGTRDAMREARRVRKMFGGGMRQAGILAAAALHALEHHRKRLVEDHVHAKAIDAALREAIDATGSGARARVLGTETNQVNIDTDVPAERLVEAAKRRGVLVGAMSSHRTRAVTHLDVPASAVPIAARALVEALREVLVLDGEPRRGVPQTPPGVLG